ncbi:MAG: serine O-acetyltransferase [Gammaproteobacteria bacterium]|jgi:serine O-acetyltransferase|nr:serine O-acetyltransferase [Gammaproteobacteria bacterium]MBT5204771.1 serine O-acetyltransferase [Gammaproteobacteria bacterium]MBT5601603.1 serine O-acetyltransferase [Gammaproteobacteria bacterium]MBT6244711.1 serine O-acetyltransferase [Gammaproteobacteria bacterium]
MNSQISERYQEELSREANIEDIAAAGSLWKAMRSEVRLRADFEPIMSTFFHASVLSHDTIEGALSFILASKLDSPVVSNMAIREIIEEAYKDDPSIIYGAEIDIKATRDRDPACNSYSTPFLFYKGFHALQAYRVAHWLWLHNRHSLAFYFQNQMSSIFGVDIHPAAQIGCGIMFDHATALVVGETAVIEDDVSILHGVTLGGTGKTSGDRHPKVRKNCLLGANASIIGNIEIGEGAKVGAGSVVLEDVPAHVTVAGVPAVIVGKPIGGSPAQDCDQGF